MEYEFPQKLSFLLTHKKRYKIAYGGRGAAKSWNFARALLIRGTERKQRFLCAREIQESIKDSVHKVLKDQIDMMELHNFYDVQERTIVGKNGTEFIFEGLKHNVNTLRSIEGIDVAWVEEANMVTNNSWEVLIPTIRKDESEIWISFNPELDTDTTYKRFVLHPPKRSIVVKVSWRDNPWFPKELYEEMTELRERNHDDYLTVWEGYCRHTLDGAIFAAEIRKSVEEDRITFVPYDESVPVQTFWDIGFRDKTAIWFVQQRGGRYNVIDFIQDRQKKVSHFLKIMQEKGYVYSFHNLPHDAESGTLASDGRGVDQQVRKVYPKMVRIVPRVKKKAISINAARTIFDQCYFDEANCAEGLECLRRYKYEVDPETGQFGRDPDHEDSHAADAFQTFAMGIRGTKSPKIATVDGEEVEAQPGGWMG